MCFPVLGKKYQIKRPPEVTGRSQGFILLFVCKGVRYDLHGIGNRLEKSQPGIGYAVSRGERVANENKYQLQLLD